MSGAGAPLSCSHAGAHRQCAPSLWQRDDHTYQGPPLRKADRFWQRARGLIGHADWLAEGGLWLSPCSGVHGMFMSRPLDLLFLDADACVLDIDRLPPGWHMRARRAARSVIELPCGMVERFDLRRGDFLIPEPR